MGYYIDGRLAILNGNNQKGYEIYQKGIEQGDINSEFGLAEMQWRGWHVQKDQSAASQVIHALYKKLLKKAKRGDSEAQTIIYTIHKREYIAKINPTLGYEMLKKAAQAPVYAPATKLPEEQ